MALNNSATCNEVEKQLMSMSIEDIATVVSEIYGAVDDLQGMLDDNQDAQDEAKSLMKKIERELMGAN